MENFYANTKSINKVHVYDNLPEPSNGNVAIK